MSESKNKPFPRPQLLISALQLAIHSPDDVDSVPTAVEQGLVRDAIMHLEYYLARLEAVEDEVDNLDRVFSHPDTCGREAFGLIESIRRELRAALEKDKPTTATCIECGNDRDVSRWLKSGPLCLPCFNDLTN